MVPAQDIFPKHKPTNGVSGWFVIALLIIVIGLMFFGIWMGRVADGEHVALQSCRNNGYVEIKMRDDEDKAVWTKVSCTKSAAEIEADALEDKTKLLRAGTFEEYKNDPQR